MSPRKDHYAVPEWVAKSIRDKRKNILYGPYDCPKCMRKRLRVLLDKKKKEVTAICHCGFGATLKYVESYEPVDYYSRILDQMRGKQN